MRSGAADLAQLAAAARREQARRYLTDFLTLLRPDYQRAPHLDLLADHLQRLDAGDMSRLMVHMPPRHGKSLHVAQAFPAWYLGRNPGHQVIIASYAAELAEAHSRAARAFLTHPLYPFATKLAADVAAVSHWRTTAGGALIATGVGGGITGFGADLLIVDDPVRDQVEAGSAATRDRISTWYADVALTRLMPGGKVLLTQTRWHHDDLCGRILASAGAREWTVLRLPALAEPGDPLQRQEGAALWPGWYPREQLLAMREAGMSSRSFASLYQQQPTPEQGGLLHRDWLGYRYQSPPERPTRTIQTVDSAFKIGVANDYSVVATWASTETAYYLLDLWRGRVEFPGLIRQICAAAEHQRPHEILIEDTASGQSAIQQLRIDTNLPVIPVRPEGSKESRVAAISGLFEAGRVCLPTAAPWLDEWIEEHLAFPAGRHDDQVDTTAMALERLRATPGPRLRLLRSKTCRRNRLQR